MRTDTIEAVGIAEGEACGGDHLSDGNVDAAMTLLDDVEAKVAQLVENPKLYQAGRVEGTRKLVRKSFIVVYVEGAGVVTILGYFMQLRCGRADRCGCSLGRIYG